MLIIEKFRDNPHFDDPKVGILPGNFKKIQLFQNKYERDIFLLSSLVGMSSCMPNVFANIRSEEITPHHYLYVVGPPESGKGMINIAKTITKDVDNLIYDSYLADLENWENRGEEDQKIASRMLRLQCSRKSRSQTVN